MKRALRVCVVAEHGSYQFGGEAVLPLHYFSRLRERNIEAWLVVHARTRAELEALFPADRDRLRFIEDAWFHKFLYRVSRMLPRRVAESTVELLNHLITQYLERRVVKEIIRQEGIDVVHQPTPVSPRAPSLMANLGVPVIIGPMNGGMEYPPSLRDAESILDRMSTSISRRLSGLMNSIFPGKKLAKILLVANKRTRLALPSGHRGEVTQLTENGVDLNTWSPLVPSPIPQRGATGRDAMNTRFVFIGRLIAWKSVNVAIEALVQAPEAQLEVIGDGPMLRQWLQLAKRLGVSQRVVFTGWLSQKECASRLQSAVALVLPSIYESGGAVVLEAMAMAKPVIATAWGGPVDYLGTDCGLLVEPSTRTAFVQGFAASMRQLIADPELCRKLGANGRKRVLASFDWESKVDRMIAIYHQSCAETDWQSDSTTASQLLQEG